MSPIEVCDVAIVGAGITGLAARRVLVQNGFQVLTLEKSRGVGGRIASRRAQGEFLDFGSQVFSQRSLKWRDAISGVAGSIRTVSERAGTGYELYTLQTGMRDLAQTIANACDPDHAPIQFENRVTRFEPTPDPRRWRICTETGREIYAKSIVLTPPTPQTVALLEASQLCDSGVYTELKNVEFRPCLAVLIAFDRPLIPHSSGLDWNPTPDFDGIFDQRTKGLPGHQNWVTFHLSAPASRYWMEQPEQDVVAFAMEQAKKIYATTASPLEHIPPALHRWRFSQPTTPLAGTHRKFEHEGLELWMGGDVFGEGDIESAFRSGSQLANALIQDQNSILNSTRAR